MGNFTLHPELARDTLPVDDLALARVLAMNDANYPWLILVPRHADAVEILDLDEPQRLQLMREIAVVARALRSVVACDKLNIAAIGNVVPQLHVHVVARRRGDPAWPRPVWGAGPPRAYQRAALEQFIEAVRRQLPLA
jgi:diadenosine tetraphosphate (Ap4A) HIT family hydrolase